MISKTFNRYIWLLNLLLQEKQLTFDEISQRWKESNLGDNKPLPLRTFHQHRSAVEELWARLTNKYRSVYKAPEIPSEQIPDAVRELESLLKEIQAMPLESFVHRKENGLLQMEELVKQFSEGLDFIVIDSSLWYSDLMSMLRSYGISYSGILDPTLSDSFPKGVTIGEKMDLLNYLRIKLRKKAAELAARKEGISI